MNLNSLQNKLVAAARKLPADDRVPLAFEKRVMAHLAAAPRANELQWWGRALWYGAGACAAIALAMSVWSFVPADSGDGISDQLEQTVLASANEAADIW
jgi:hypothetical protein